MDQFRMYARAARKSGIVATQQLNKITVAANTNRLWSPEIDSSSRPTTKLTMASVSPSTWGLGRAAPDRRA